jgi:hypothetical protein
MRSTGRIDAATNCRWSQRSFGFANPLQPTLASLQQDEAEAAGEPDAAAKPGDTPSQLLADAGYCSDVNLAAVADTTIDAYISTRKQKHGERLGPCPRGPLPKTATIVDWMARKLQTKAGAAAYAARQGIVEPVIGQIKQARGFRQFVLRGFEKVQGEWSLVCTTHNILKLYRLCI